MHFTQSLLHTNGKQLPLLHLHLLTWLQGAVYPDGQMLIWAPTGSAVEALQAHTLSKQGNVCSQIWIWTPWTPSFLPTQQLSRAKAELLCAGVGLESRYCPWSQIRKGRAQLWAAQPLHFPKASLVIDIPEGTLAHFESLVPRDRLDVC